MSITLTKSGSRKLAAQFSRTRFIYTAEDWTTDSYTAIAAHIEPNSKRVQIEAATPSIHPIINSLRTREALDKIVHHNDDPVVITSKSFAVKVNKRYYDDLVLALSGVAWPRLTGTMSPVVWVDDEDNIVALLMPLRG